LLPYMQRFHRLSAYKLKHVAPHFLAGARKKDMRYDQLALLQAGSDSDRASIAAYCLQDARLPILLIDKLAILLFYFDLAPFLGVTLNTLLTHDPQPALFSLLYRRSVPERILIPDAIQDTDHKQKPVSPPLLTTPSSYLVPSAPPEADSIYSVAVEEHNICFSTLLPPRHSGDTPPDPLVVCVGPPHAFVASEVRPGLLPDIVRQLRHQLPQRLADGQPSQPTQRLADGQPSQPTQFLQEANSRASHLYLNSVLLFAKPGFGLLPCAPLYETGTYYFR
ncbi:hypothetical protein B484DRAFT_306569, partial [Ochromonadaceae sp. CCMP2298]